MVVPTIHRFERFLFHLRYPACGAARRSARRSARHCWIVLAAVTILVGLVHAADPQPEPATPAQAAAVLDLRNCRTMEGATSSSHRTIAQMLYEAQSDVQSAYAFQQQELVKSGWQELEGGYVTDQVASGTFARGGFKLSVTVTPSGNGAAANISVMNHGNVDTAKLPIPAGCELLYATPVSTAYVTARPVPETAEQLRTLLVAANWVPYGEAGESSYFKRNAVKLAARVTVAPAQGGKTVVEFSSEQMSADLPAPPKSVRIQYADVTKSLSFDTSLSYDEVAAFYREVLAHDAWKATTENLIKIDFEHLLIFRNPPLDLLELKLTTVDNVTRGELRVQTKAEVDELEKQLQEKTATHAAEPAAPATRVEIPLPADARDVESNDDSLEFTVARGRAQATVVALRKYFKEAGWKEETATFEPLAGNLTVIKDQCMLTVVYADVGVEPAQISVMAIGAELVPQKPVKKPK